jgi:DinB superfamily
MNECERLAIELDKALNGGAWHGPSFREALEGVDHRTAQGRPIPEAHSIAEIVLHAATWHDVVRRRLSGETPQVSDAEDWPPAQIADDTAWRKIVDRLGETGHDLCNTVRGFPEVQLHEKRPRVDDTWYALISGELQHVLYHAGQVSILKKATAGR